MQNNKEKRTVIFDFAAMPALFEGIEVDFKPRFNILTEGKDVQAIADQLVMNSKLVVDAERAKGVIDIAVITGPGPKWLDQIFVHEIMHRCGELRYDNGSGINIRIAKHG